MLIYKIYIYVSLDLDQIIQGIFFKLKILRIKINNNLGIINIIIYILSR